MRNFRGFLVQILLIKFVRGQEGKRINRAIGIIGAIGVGAERAIENWSHWSFNEQSTAATQVACPGTQRRNWRSIGANGTIEKVEIGAIVIQKSTSCEVD